MKRETHTTRSAEETIRLARRFARRLKPGDILCLNGELGSGKTTFIKGIALGLGLNNADEVKSPTFVVMHMYPTRIPLYHFDLYRLESPDDFETIGLEDFAFDRHAITCVEWAEKAGNLFSAGAYRIQMKSGTRDRRTLTIEFGSGKKER